MHRSQGHCMVMGTASTMASMDEALGLILPGNAAIPAVDARRALLARPSVLRMVEMVGENLKISNALSRAYFEHESRVKSVYRRPRLTSFDLRPLSGT